MLIEPGIPIIGLPPIEQLPHLGWRPGFGIPTATWILDTLNAEAS